MGLLIDNSALSIPAPLPNCEEATCGMSLWLAPSPPKVCEWNISTVLWLWLFPGAPMYVYRSLQMGGGEMSHAVLCM